MVVEYLGLFYVLNSNPIGQWLVSLVVNLAQVANLESGALTWTPLPAPCSKLLVINYILEGTLSNFGWFELQFQLLRFRTRIRLSMAQEGVVHS